MCTFRLYILPIYTNRAVITMPRNVHANLINGIGFIVFHFRVFDLDGSGPV